MVFASITPVMLLLRHDQLWCMAEPLSLLLQRHLAVKVIVAM